MADTPSEIYYSIHPIVRERVAAAAQEHNLPFRVVMALVYHESVGGQPFAKRSEPAFLEKYQEMLDDMVARINNPFTSYLWRTAPIDFASSYGLMQVMWSTAFGQGFRGTFPGQLFDMQLNLRYGCSLLTKLLDQTDNDIEVSLDAYNDGRPDDRDEDGDLIDVDYVNLIRLSYSQLFPDDQATELSTFSP
jgi:hypothetical protein